MAGTLEPPVRRGQPLRLRDSVTVNSDTAERWEMGFTFRPRPCVGGGIFDPCITPNLVPPRGRAPIHINPFVVWGGDDCSAFGWTAANYRERAIELLDMQTDHRIARELWRGEQAIISGWANPHLASLDSHVVTAGPQAPIAALACLEQGIQACSGGQRGMIHAMPQLVTHWAALGNSVLRREGGQLLTIHDTIVVSDGGYTGSGPGDTPATTSQWAYATGLVSIELGEISVYPETLEQAFDSRVLDNDISFLATRPAVAYWDNCCHLAAEVNLVPCAVGPAS